MRGLKFDRLFTTTALVLALSVSAQAQVFTETPSSAAIESKIPMPEPANVPPPSAADVAQRGLSVLDDARLLYRRDGTPAGLLLRMATTNGAAALGLDLDRFSLREGAAPLGIAAVDVNGTRPDRPTLDRVMAAAGAIELLQTSDE